MDIEKKYEKAAKALTILLNMQRNPVGIKFIKTRQEYERIQATEPKSGLPYCTAVEKAGEGRTYKLDWMHNRCAAASIALGMLPVDEYRLSGQMHADLKVYRDVKVSKSVAHDMVYCKEENTGVLVRPLEKYSEEQPDMIILILKPKWAMRFIQGYAYNFGQLKDIKMAGMCAICQECTSYPWNMQQPNISMLCSGTRCVGQWHDDELGVGFPAKYIDDILDGIWNTIDPMENKKTKEKLISDLSKAGLEIPEIDMGHNYYSKAYRIPKQK